MPLTVKQLKELLARLDIPDDAEVWIEHPLVKGVVVADHPTHEIVQPPGHAREDWIVGTTIGWSAAQNRLRICHHPAQP